MHILEALVTFALWEMYLVYRLELNLKLQWSYFPQRRFHLIMV